MITGVMENCRNCGAPHLGDCEYCGTRYAKNEPVNCAGMRQPIYYDSTSQVSALDYQTANLAYIQAQTARQ